MGRPFTSEIWRSCTNFTVSLGNLPPAVCNLQLVTQTRLDSFSRLSQGGVYRTGVRLTNTRRGFVLPEPKPDQVELISTAAPVPNSLCPPDHETR
jgi:hypothetical protein